MADIIDRANDLADMFTQQSIDRLAQKRAQEALEREELGFDGYNCVECDVRIPRERLALGAYRCVLCQADHEHQQKRFRSRNG